MDTVERLVTLPVDLEEVWDLVTRPDELRAWLGAEVELDPTPGSAGRVVDHDGNERHLVVDLVEPGQRIGWSWWSDATPDERSHVEISLSPAPGGTIVRVVEELGTAAPVAQARAGEAWSHRLLHLEALLLIAATVRG